MHDLSVLAKYEYTRCEFNIYTNSITKFDKMGLKYRRYFTNRVRVVIGVISFCRMCCFAEWSVVGQTTSVSSLRPRNEYWIV